MINITTVGVPAGLGLVDEGLEWWDSKSGRVGSFKTATDVGRFFLACVGYGLQVFMPKHDKFGEVLAIAETPLLIKSIAKPIRAAIGGPASLGYIPKRSVTERTGSPIGAYQPINPKPELY